MAGLDQTAQHVIQKFQPDLCHRAYPPSKLRTAYDAHIVPAPGRNYLQAALGLGNALNFANPNRAPLLLIAGGPNGTSTTSMVAALLRQHQKSPRPAGKKWRREF